MAFRCVQRACVLGRDEGQTCARPAEGDCVWRKLRPVSPARAPAAEARRSRRRLRQSSRPRVVHGVRSHQRREGCGGRPRTGAGDVRAIHEGERRPGAAGRNAFAHALQLRIAHEQLGGYCGGTSAIHPAEAHAGHDQQGVRALSAGHSGRHSRGRGELIHREQQDRRHARDTSGDEMSARRVAFALALAVLLQTSAFTQTASVLQHGTSPLITFRILFMTGSAFDPAGKEGLASLTAAMIGEGGSRSKTYQQIVDEMYPMATSVNWQVDKEMTVFTGTTHVENLDRFYGLINDMLLDPGFRQEDFTRGRDEAVNFLKVSLRESNDEELGKEYLYNAIYAGHPYGHHNRGTVSSLQKLTVADVRAFYREHYTRT